MKGEVGDELEEATDDDPQARWWSPLGPTRLGENAKKDDGEDGWRSIVEATTDCPMDGGVGGVGEGSDERGEHACCRFIRVCPVACLPCVPRLLFPLPGRRDTQNSQTHADP